MIRYKEKFNGYYDGIFATINAICDPLLGERHAKIGNEVVVTGIGCDLFFPALHYKGIIPIFIDVNLDTFLPDLDVIENCIVEGKTKAVISVSALGNTVDLVKLRDICDEYNILLVEASFGDCVSGTGDISIYKEDNGLVVQVHSNPIFEQSIRASKEKLEFTTGKFKISQHYLYDNLVVYKKYFRFQTSDSNPDWHGFSITVKETAPFDKYDLANHLKENGIQVKFIDSGILLLQPSFKNIKHTIFQDLINSNVIMRDTLVIPLKQNRREESIVKTIKEFVESKIYA
jgi:dTDP-4-amino-4,6-dideoxygalactose transaminase